MKYLPEMFLVITLLVVAVVWLIIGLNFAILAWAIMTMGWFMVALIGQAIKGLAALIGDKSNS